jgi:hypothetical protein
MSEEAISDIVVVLGRRNAGACAECGSSHDTIGGHAVYLTHPSLGVVPISVSPFPFLGDSEHLKRWIKDACGQIQIGWLIATFGSDQKGWKRRPVIDIRIIDKQKSIQATYQPGGEAVTLREIETPQEETP